MLNRLLSLFLKPNCPLCQRSANEVFCNYCIEKLDGCELKHDYQELVMPDFLLFAWGKYDYALKNAIAALKYEQKPEIGYRLGIWLGAKWLAVGNHKKYTQLIVIPIPSDDQRTKSRGYNQAELIARGFCQMTKYSLKTNLLIRQKQTQAMFGLNISQRKRNIAQAFKIGQDYQQLNYNDRLLIIDDIYTTGTTVSEATRILTKAKLKTIGVATVSRVIINK